MDAEESRDIQPDPEPETPKIPPELLKVKMDALAKASARKKEIGLIKKAEKMKKNEELDIKINQAKEQLKVLQPSVSKIEVPPLEKKKVRRVVEKVIEEESSSEEEVIERIIIKKKNQSKRAPVRQEEEDYDDQMITQSNKELLQKKLKDEQRKKLMADLFSY